MNLFESQPSECRLPLTLERKVVTRNKSLKRLLSYDPSEIYKRLHESNGLNPFKRHSKINFSILFPRVDGVCSCGCGKKLKGRQRRWASVDCRNLAATVYYVISGNTTYLRKLRKIIIGGYYCEVCLKQESKLELDHLIPVKHGGGGCWLSNYQFKCKHCHRIKTNADFGYKSKK